MSVVKDENPSPEDTTTVITPCPTQYRHYSHNSLSNTVPTLTNNSIGTDPLNIEEFEIHSGVKGVGE